MTEAKFTSFTTCDFLNDVDLDIFIDALEKSAPIWVEEMKSRGLLRWSRLAPGQAYLRSTQLSEGCYHC